MKNLKQVIDSNEADGTSFHSVEIEATPLQLNSILGKPTYTQNNGRDKVNMEWVRKTISGHVFTVYDYKEYRKIKSDEVISWHIGGAKPEHTIEAGNQIMEALNHA